jgi:hypothetical protein
MILLAGVLIVLAFFLYSTQSTVVSTIGQESGREAANPVLSDFQGLRSSIATQLKYELWNSAGTAICPTDEAEFRGKVQAKLVLIAKLESNRGQIFAGNFLDMVPAVNVDSDPALELKTVVRLYLTNGRSTVTDTVTFITECT